MKNIIELVNLSEKGCVAKGFNTISLTINKGQIFGLFDSRDQKIINVLQTIVGNRKELSGTLRVFGETDIIRIRHRIGTTFDIQGVRSNYSVEKNLQMIAMIKDVEVKYVNEVITNFHLKTHRQQLLKNCSNEVKQLVALACAFLGNPDLIVLTHPLKHISGNTKYLATLKKHIRKAAKNGQTLLIGTHPNSLLFEVCNATHCINQVKVGNINIPRQAKQTKIYEISSKKPLRLQNAQPRRASA